MDRIDVHDLPEPVARAIQLMVEELRRQLSQAAPKKQPKELPRWEGQVLGSLTREELYDDVG